MCKVFKCSNKAELKLIIDQRATHDAFLTHAAGIWVVWIVAWIIVHFLTIITSET